MNTEALIASRQTTPLRTLADVKTCLERDKRRGLDVRMARLLLKHGRLTDEAILYIGDNYPTVWED